MHSSGGIILFLVAFFAPPAAGLLPDSVSARACSGGAAARLPVPVRARTGHGERPTQHRDRLRLARGARFVAEDVDHRGAADLRGRR